MIASTIQVSLVCVKICQVTGGSSRITTTRYTSTFVKCVLDERETMANTNISPSVIVNMRKNLLKSSPLTLSWYPSQSESVISYPFLTVSVDISLSNLLPETVQSMLFADFTASSFVIGKCHASYPPTSAFISQGKYIKTFASWHWSHQNYFAPGGHKAQVTLSDNIIE